MDNLNSCMYGEPAGYYPPNTTPLPGTYPANHLQSLDHTSHKPLTVGRGYTNYSQPPDYRSPQANYNSYLCEQAQVYPKNMIGPEYNNVNIHSSNNHQTRATSCHDEMTSKGMYYTECGGGKHSPSDTTQSNAQNKGKLLQDEKRTGPKHDSLNSHDSEFIEDVDDDTISDDDEMEASYRAYLESMRNEPQSDSDSKLLAGNLLIFARNAASDIKRYFGLKEGQVDIYGSNHWVRGKSGRDLYYSDLLKIAQGENEAEERTKTRNQKKKCDSKVLGKVTRDTRSKEVKGKELGPLAELFNEFVPSQDSLKENGENTAKQMATKDCQQPLQKRKLPNSFWIEPVHDTPNKLSKHVQ